MQEIKKCYIFSQYLYIEKESRGKKNMEQYLTIKEVCKNLNLTKMTVYKMIKNGDLPAHKVGRKYNISPSEIEKFMQGKRVSA